MNLNGIINSMPLNDLNQMNISGVNTINLANANKNSTYAVQKNIKNIHEFTKVGFSGQGVKKVNQDNYFVFRNFNGSPQNIFMAVW